MSAKEKWPDRFKVVSKPVYLFEDWLVTEAEIPHQVLRGSREHVARACETMNACAGMENPAEEIQSMREVLNEIASRNCADLKQQEKPCDEFENWTPDMYCPSCLARHTLKNL